MEPIRNRVSESGIVSVDPESWMEGISLAYLDVKDILFQGMILREKDLREFISVHPWDSYKDRVVCLSCSADAIIPQWAWMLLTSALQPFAKAVHCCAPEDIHEKILLDYIAGMDPLAYANKRVVVKGCSSIQPGPEVFVQLSKKLLPVVSSLMFGEPCSSVPVFKRPKNPDR
jgi:hypothetical protein